MLPRKNNALESVNSSKEIQNVVLNVQATARNHSTEENPMINARNTPTCQNVIESVQQSVSKHSRMESPKTLVLHTKMSQAVITHLVHSLARMLLTASSAQENAKSTRGTGNVAMDAHQSAKLLLAKEKLWKNAGNTTWSLTSVSMRNVLGSAWTRLRKENARLNVRNMQEIPSAASVVIVLLSARRNHYGENVQHSARSLQAILTAVRRHVRQNAPTRGERSAVQAEWQNVMAFLAAAPRSLMLYLALGFTWITRISDYYSDCDCDCDSVLAEILFVSSLCSSCYLILCTVQPCNETMCLSTKSNICFCYLAIIAFSLLLMYCA